MTVKRRELGQLRTERIFLHICSSLLMRRPAGPFFISDRLPWSLWSVLYDLLSDESSNTYANEETCGTVFLFVISCLRSCDRFLSDLLSEDSSNTYAKKDVGREKLGKPFVLCINLAFWMIAMELTRRRIVHWSDFVSTTVYPHEICFDAFIQGLHPMSSFLISAKWELFRKVDEARGDQKVPTLRKY